MERRLRFRDVFPSGTARGLLGWPFGYGVWVVDIGHWQWEGYRVAVLSDYEDGDRLFVAASVEELTDPAPEANPRPPVGN